MKQQKTLMSEMRNSEALPGNLSVSHSRIPPVKKYKKKTSKRRKRHTYLKKKSKTVNKVMNAESGFKNSLWKLHQNIAYMHYLIENEQLFYASRNQRKNMKINVLMSNCIKSRSPDQCRSHHQKMIKYHRDIPNIISHIKVLERRCQQSKMQASNNPCSLLQGLFLSPDDEDLRSLSVEALLPTGCWDSWNMRSDMFEQDRHIEQWLNGVEDKYGNL